MEENNLDEDHLVEIARFQYPAEAQTLMSLLRSEGIDCYLRDELTNQVLGGMIDVGGIRVEILESEVQHAMQVMKDGGYPLPSEDAETEQIEEVAGFTGRIPILRKLPLEKRIFVMIVVIALLLGLFIAIGYIIA
jgi:hypothetical protein